MLALIGSGETSPTMVTLHRELVARLGPRPPQAVMLATPYAFQVNATGVSARTQRYFARSVGLEVSVSAGTSELAGAAVAPPMLETLAGADAEPARIGEAARIRQADWLFAGPGNPSYALAHWQAGPVAAILRERVLAGHGVTVLASAAAATAGMCTVPVYEIYKAGGALEWLPGLDVLGLLGLKVAVIPHFDNAEGRDYDTRYCYLGERRLLTMERQLPAGTAILGLDEHTAVLIDLRAGTVDVRGRGGLTVRRAGTSTVLAAGARVSVADLRQLVAAGHQAGGTRPRTGATVQARAAAQANQATQATQAEPATQVPLPELTAAAEQNFATAAASRDAGKMVEVILELEAAVKDWEGDTEEDQGTEQARAIVRNLIARLGQVAQAGLAGPRKSLQPVVGPLLELRAALRDQGRFADADAIRDALSAAGLDVRDTPEGTRWQGPA